jgi:hypothetical protein
MTIPADYAQRPQAWRFCIFSPEDTGKAAHIRFFTAAELTDLVAQEEHHKAVECMT